MHGLKRLILGASAALGPMVAWADLSWSFPDPVTPIAKETLHVHNLFMVIALLPPLPTFPQTS